jgi:hypothetical protein
MATNQPHVDSSPFLFCIRTARRELRRDSAHGPGTEVTSSRLTGQTATLIVYVMLRPVHSMADRVMALSAAIAFLVVVLASTGAFVAGGDASGEPCFSCSGCDSGECGDGDGAPPMSHHHCCTTSCLAHASAALPSAHSAPAPVIVGPMARTPSVAVTSRVADTPYRPPRV